MTPPPLPRLSLLQTAPPTSPIPHHFAGCQDLTPCRCAQLCVVWMLPQPHASPPISELGWDALTELPDLKAFATLLQSSQRVVKAVLLDQAVLCGIGNWIADEVLFQVSHRGAEGGYRGY